MALINQQLESLDEFKDFFEAVSLSGEDKTIEYLENLIIRIPDDKNIRFVYACLERIKLGEPKTTDSCRMDQQDQETSDSCTMNEKIRKSLEEWIKASSFTDIFCDDAYLEPSINQEEFRKNSEELQELRKQSPSTRWVIMSTMSETEIDRIKVVMQNVDVTPPRTIKSPSYFRRDICYEVVDGEADFEKIRNENKGDSGLIFTRYRADAEKYAEELGQPVARYFHGTSWKTSNRKEVVQDWRQRKFPILVATYDSFRWGIVKFPLDFIYHSIYPKSLQFYYTVKNVLILFLIHRRIIFCYKF